MISRESSAVARRLAMKADSILHQRPSSTQKTGVSRSASKLGAISILDRYMFGHVAGAILGGLCWFLGILLVAVVITAVQKIVSNGLSATEFVTFVALQLPRMIVFAMPMAVLFGCVQSFSALAKSGEVVAMQAAGVSLVRLLRMPLFCALVATLTVYYLQESLVPHLESQKDAILVAHIQEHLSGPGPFRYEDPPSDEGPLKTLIQARHFDLKTQTLDHPRVSVYNEDQLLTSQITAESAKWNGHEWEMVNIQNVRLDANKSGGSTSSKFQSGTVDMPPPAFLGGSGTSVDKQLKRGDFLMVPMTGVMSYRRGLETQLLSAQNKAQRKTVSKSIKTATFGLHDKIATPLICFAFALVGVPLGARTKQRSGGGAMGLSLLVLLGYYVIWTWTSTLGRAGVAPPVLMAYFSLALVTVVGIVLVQRQNR